MFDPDETIHTSRQAFRLFEVVWQKGFEPCSNGSVALYEAKIKAAERRGNIKSADLWRKASDLDRLCYQNPAIIIIMDGKRFHARYEVDENYCCSIRRAEPYDFTQAEN